MPDGITRARWTVSRQDRYGTVYPAPLQHHRPGARATSRSRPSPAAQAATNHQSRPFTTPTDTSSTNTATPATLTRVHKATSTKATSHFCQKHPGACNTSPPTKNRPTVHTGTVGTVSTPATSQFCLQNPAACLAGVRRGVLQSRKLRSIGTSQTGRQHFPFQTKPAVPGLDRWAAGRDRTAASCWLPDHQSHVPESQTVCFDRLPSGRV